MVNIPLLRTRRLNVQLHELTISQAMSIAAMDGEREQASCTAFLRFAVGDSGTGNYEDPADWTVQERTLAICHYLAATSDGSPDFAVGDNAHYSDYLLNTDVERITENYPVGELEGDKWQIRHLTGRMAESIERMAGEVKDANGNPLSGRAHWILGGMACQLVRDGETAPNPQDGEGAFDEWLVGRMEILSNFPESSFALLLNMYYTGREKLEHLFRIEFAGNGIDCLPTKEGADGEKLPHARFSSYACISEVAVGMARKP